jgi:hypothetical protein
MSNRNFDAHAIILRLQNKNIAQSNYAHQKRGQAIINNPQTSNGNASVMPYYTEGMGTTYQQSLESTYTKDPGGICNLIQTPTYVCAPPSAPYINSILWDNPHDLQYYVNLTQVPALVPITNYQYSIDGGVTYTVLSPTQATSPIIITFPALDVTYNVVIKAITACGSSDASNVVQYTPDH